MSSDQSNAQGQQGSILSSTAASSAAAFFESMFHQLAALQSRDAQFLKQGAQFYDDVAGYYLNQAAEARWANFLNSNNRIQANIANVANDLAESFCGGRVVLTPA
jgi:hypothetical protein